MRNYTVVRQLGNGAFAASYEARSTAGRVFLKQYKMPTVATPWYRRYLEMQREMKHRIEASAAKRYCYRFVEFFEETVGTPCYFQVFEFIERGHDLRAVLDRVAGAPDAVPWAQRWLFAKVMMAGIKALHGAKVVHTDLKPENVHLIEDPTIEAGYLVRLIDLDFSILADRDPPWSGDPAFACVGTAGYLSPEHLRGEVPTPESDMFTCGLMLYELLSEGGHPCRAVSDDAYRAWALKGAVAPPRLQGDVAPAKAADVSAAIHKCLAPRPGDRPTASELQAVLLGSAPAISMLRWSCPKCGTAATGGERRCLACGHVEYGRLVLQDGSRSARVTFNIDTVVGRNTLAPLVGGDVKYIAEEQFKVVRDPASAGWAIVAVPGATNRTMLNGLAVGTTPERLRDDAIISIGKPGVAAVGVRVEF